MVKSGIYKYELHDNGEEATRDANYKKEWVARRPQFTRELEDTLEIRNDDDYSAEQAENESFETTKTLTEGVPISVSSTRILQKLKNTQRSDSHKKGIQGFTFIDKNHFAVAEIAGVKGYLSVYDMSGKLLSTIDIDTHNNSIQADGDKIISIGGTENSGTNHQIYELDVNNYQLGKQQVLNNVSGGNAIGIDSYNSKDYIIRIGRRKRIYLFKRQLLWNRKRRNRNCFRKL